MSIQAVIFDMDGVLVDTEQFICEAAMKMFAELGVQTKEEDYLDFVGMGEDRYLGGVADKYNIDLDLPQAKTRTYEIYDSIVQGRLEPLDGVHAFIQTCKEKGLKTAVATSADRPKMVINLREMGYQEDDFSVCINGSEIERKKPHPDIFLKAAQQMHVDPQNCLVVEDAITGVQAAKAAGCKALALMTSFSAEQLSQADWVANTLADAPPEVLEW